MFGQFYIARGNIHCVFEAHRAEVAMLARLDARGIVALDQLPTPPQKAVSLVLGAVTVYLPLAQMVDVEAEKARLSKELADVEAQIEKSEKLLASDFGKKAPAPIVQKERDKLADLKQKREKLAEQLKALA